MSNISNQDIFAAIKAVEAKIDGLRESATKDAANVRKRLGAVEKDVAELKRWRSRIEKDNPGKVVVARQRRRQ